MFSIFPPLFSLYKEQSIVIFIQWIDTLVLHHLFSFFEFSFHHWCVFKLVRNSIKCNMIWYPCSEFHNCTAIIHQLPPQMQPLSLSHCGSQPNYPKINSCFTTTPKSQPLFPDHYYTKQICVSWPSLSLSLSPRYFVFDVCLHFSIFLFSFFF